MNSLIDEIGCHNKSRSLRMFILFLFVVIAVMAVLILLSMEVKAGTNVWGHITADTIWNATGSPYNARQDVYVDEGVNLTIEPGVEVKCARSSTLYVDGNLRALGNETHRIIFTSEKSTPSPSDWDGIWVRQNGSAYIDNCEISYAYYGVRTEYSMSHNTILNTSIEFVKHGIYIRYSSNVTLSSIQTHDATWGGISIYYSSDVTIADVHFSNITGGGILFYLSSNTTISNATFWNLSYHGISLHTSSNITVTKAQFWNVSKESLMLEGTEKIHYLHSIADCSTDGKPIYYCSDARDITVEDLDADLIILAGCENVTFIRCNVTDGRGIYLYYTINSTIMFCDVSYSYHGLFLDSSSKNTVLCCNLVNNSFGISLYSHSNFNSFSYCNVSYSDHGFFLDSSSENTILNCILSNNSVGISLCLNSYSNTITDCTVSSNDYGIHLESDSDGNEITDNYVFSNSCGIYVRSSRYNMIYHNNFINNNNQVDESLVTYGDNHWDNVSEGNHWSDYSGSDLGGDGIGDDPYPISSRSNDNFPLINPWNGSLAPDTTLPYFTSNPDISAHTLEIPGDILHISFGTNEFCAYEIIIDTDGRAGFDNTSDVVLSGNVSQGEVFVFWEGFDREGNYVEDGVYQIQIMLWDLARNSLAGPFNIGNVSTLRDLDLDGVIDANDVFPEDPGEWEDRDNDGIGDNSDNDWDNDGVDNNDDEFPFDSDEWSDRDGDHIGDNADPDDNGNHIPDIAEIPLVIAVLLIPLLVIHFTNKHVKTMKEKKEKDKD